MVSLQVGNPTAHQYGFAISAKQATLVQMKLELDDVAVFTRIAELGTLSAAARERNTLAYSANPQMNRWPLKNAGKDVAYQARAHTRSDNVALILALAREGAGVGRVMDLLAAPLIRRGELVPLLQDEIDSECVPIYALMLQERHRLPKIRACIDYWAQWLAELQTTSTGVRNAAVGQVPSAIAERPQPQKGRQPGRRRGRPQRLA